MSETNKVINRFGTLSLYLKRKRLSWNKCVGICTDWAMLMVEFFKSSFCRNKIMPILTKCIPFFTEMLISKSLGKELENVFTDAQETKLLNKMVSFIKQIKKKLSLFLFCVIISSVENIFLGTFQRLLLQRLYSVYFKIQIVLRPGHDDKLRPVVRIRITKFWETTS